MQQPVVERAKQMGLRTICFAWPQGAVCKDLCDVFYPVSVTDGEGRRYLGTIDVSEAKNPTYRPPQ